MPKRPYTAFTFTVGAVIFFFSTIAILLDGQEFDSIGQTLSFLSHAVISNAFHILTGVVMTTIAVSQILRQCNHLFAD